MSDELDEALSQLGFVGQDRIALLVDGRNCAYRAIYANRAEQYSGVRYHSLVVLIRFIHAWMERFRPHDVHVFWDAPRKSLWRRRILPTYKDRPVDPNREDISRELANVQEAAQAILTHMNVRQYSRKGQEADDLIYAACRCLRDRPVVVVSSDGDFYQLVYHLHNVLLYEPRLNKLQEAPRVDPNIQKALEGDDSDRIGGYPGIGPVKSQRLAGSLHDRLDFLAARGRDLFLRNMLLVDLNLCPYLLNNQLYVERIMASDTTYSRSDILRLASQFKVNGLLQEYDRIVAAFKYLSGRPDDNYQCPECGSPQFKCPSGWSCQNGHGYGDPTPRSAGVK